MSGPMELVCLTGPAKIDGRWRGAGETVEVDHDILHDLTAAGAIDPKVTGVMELVPGGTGFDEAVNAMAKALADAAVAAAVEVATAKLTEERDFYRTSLENVEAQLRSAQASNNELEAEIADLKDQGKAGEGDRDAGQSPAPGTPADASVTDASAEKPARKKAATAKG
ncbi:MAG: hypothetical protein ACK46Q_07410 [Hyphomonas sp.]